MRKIQLAATDGGIIQVHEHVAKCSLYIKDILTRFPLKIPLIIFVPNVTTYSLYLAMVWAKHHKNDVLDNESWEINDSHVISDWDTVFLNEVQEDVITNLVVTAHLLDMKPLWRLLCNKFKSIVAAKSKDELREFLTRIEDEAEMK